MVALALAVGTLATLVEGRIDSEGGSVHRFIKTKTSALLSIQSPDCAPKQAAAAVRYEDLATRQKNLHTMHTWHQSKLGTVP